MAVATSPYLKQSTQASNALLMLGVAGLVAFGAACGVALAMGEIQALYVTLALIGCIGILIDYRIGAVLLVLLYPVSLTQVFPHQLMGITGLNPINLLIVATAGAWLLRGRMENLRAVMPKPLVLLYIVPILVAGLFGAQHVDDIVPFFYETMAIVYTNGIGYYRDEVIKPMLLVAAVILFAAAVARSDKPERFIPLMAYSACALALVEFAFVALSSMPLGYLASARSRTFFASEIGLHANGLGRMFVSAYALLLFVWWETKRPGLKLGLAVALSILALGTLLTFSRAAFLAFFVVNGLFVLWKFNMKKLALGIFGLAVAVAMAPGYLYSRIMYGVASGDANTVSAGRTEGIWAPLLPEIWKNPVLGDGIGSTMWSFPMQAGAMEVVNHPHNAYLEAVLDMGFVGLVLLGLFYLHVWRGSRALGSNAYLTPELRAFFQGACAGLIAYAVTCMTGGSLRPEPANAFVWFAIGMMYGVLARKPTA